MSARQLPDSSYAFLERILLAKSLLTSGEDLSRDECLDFWCSEDVADWFKTQGYTPYKRDFEACGEPSRTTSPRLPFAVFQDAEYPYAYHHATTEFEGEGELTLSIHDPSGRIIFAQDQELRHVAIKAMHADSEEYRIALYMNQFHRETLRESCLLPILDLFCLRKACFVVMPRWGSDIAHPKEHKMIDILMIMRSALKALAFLHSHKIIHRDIRFENILVNHFGNDAFNYPQTRIPQLQQGSLEYALIDFDVSNILPPTTDKRTYRLPYWNTFIGFLGPNDVAQGEFDYNPFAYDVGCLGYMFCHYYQHLTKDFPFFAPLLDMMTTADISRRFTAEEALRFVDHILTEAEPAQLSVVETPRGGEHYETCDRWKGLPIEFKEKWSSYRTPVGVPFTSRILRKIVESKYLRRDTVPWVRWFFYRVFSLPRILGKTLSGLF